MARIVGPNNPFALQRITPSKTFKRSPKSETMSAWGSPEAFPAVDAIGGIIAGTVGSAMERRAIEKAALSRLKATQEAARKDFVAEETRLRESGRRQAPSELAELQRQRQAALAAEEAGSGRFLGMEYRRPDVERQAIEDALYDKSYDRALSLAAAASHETNPAKALELRAAAARAAAEAHDRPRGGSLTGMMAGEGEERITEDLKRLYPQVDLRERKHPPRAPRQKVRHKVATGPAQDLQRHGQRDNLNVRILDAANEFKNTGGKPTENFIRIPADQAGAGDSTESVLILTPTAQQTRQMEMMDASGKQGVYRALYDAAQRAQNLSDKDRESLNKSLSRFQDAAQSYALRSGTAFRDDQDFLKFWDDPGRRSDRLLWTAKSWSDLMSRHGRAKQAPVKKTDVPKTQPTGEPQRAGLTPPTVPDTPTPAPDAGMPPVVPDTGVPAPDAGSVPVSDAGAVDQTPEGRRARYKTEKRNRELFGVERLEDSEFYSDKYPDRKARVDQLMQELDATTDDSEKLRLANTIRSILRGKWD